MNNRNSGSILAALSALLILVLGAGLMTLNPAGITAGLRDGQHQGFVNIQPTANAAPAGGLGSLKVRPIATRILGANPAGPLPGVFFLFGPCGAVGFLFA